MNKALYLLLTTAFVPPQIARPADAEASATPTGLQSLDRWLDENAPKPFSDGELLLHARPRYEHADQDGLTPSNAFTVRSRLGFKTAPLHHFQALIEAEDIRTLGSEDNFNQAGLSGPGRTVIADPETTEVNRAWIAYEQFDTRAALGRQRIIVDNARFIGNVGWRQNEQTYDAASLKSEIIPDVTAQYHYLFRVHRILGDNHPQGEWNSDSHLVNIDYNPFPWGTWTGYAYLLDLESAPLSNASVGLRFSGRKSLTSDLALSYEAEYAWQTDYVDNPASYETEYYHLNLLGEWDRFRLGGGYEVLGSDAGVGFSTPLATLHAFNGWADAFLATPGRGLRDAYLQAGVDLPFSIPLNLIYHNFRSETGDRDFGNELDVVLSRKLGKHFTALAKWATYDGGANGPPDRQKFWLQMAFDY